MKGSLFRGLDGIINHNNLYNRIHINGNAIYNLSDESFSNFFINVVRRVIKAKFHDNGAYDTDIFRVLLWGMHNTLRPSFTCFNGQILFRIIGILNILWKKYWKIRRIHFSFMVANLWLTILSKCGVSLSKFGMTRMNIQNSNKSK